MKEYAKKDLYTEIANNIISQLTNGIIPWKKPWKTLTAKGYTSQKPYSLLNQLLLGEGGEYITFNQCEKLGGKVKKGSKCKYIYFWKWIEKETDEKDEEGNPIKKKIPMLREYAVFNINQCEGIDSKSKIELNDDFADIEKADEAIREYLTRENIQTIEGESAYYSPAFDNICLPAKNRFMNNSEYYSTAFHEMVHSTGVEKRLNRDLKNTFGSDGYSFEECVAEFGASFMLGMLGIADNDTTKNSTAYIQSWSNRIKADTRTFISACTKAEKAVNFILGINTTESEEAA